MSKVGGEISEEIRMKDKVLKYGIFTKQVHVEKLSRFLNEFTDINYFLSTDKNELHQIKFDIGVSYCFPKIINLEDFPKTIWFNYHPAPLIKNFSYKGLTCYSDGIRDKVNKWGVSLHKMEQEVDSGDLLSYKKFKLEDFPISDSELGSITHYHLFQLFKKTIESLKTDYGFYRSNINE